MAIHIDDTSLKALRKGLSDEILLPESAGYEEARRLFNAMIDRRPGIIAQCADAEDVVSAVNSGRMKRVQRTSRQGDSWCHRLGSCRAWLGLGLGSAVVSLTGCALGEYRMPYADGTVVVVNADHVTHTSPPAYSYDISALNPLPASIVAAAPGIVRFVVDSNEEPTKQNNYVWIEHLQYAYECGGEPCTEWTVYAHFEKGSVAVEPGNVVLAGSFLGIESDVGDADGVHLHWHVAVLPPDVQPTFNGYYLDYYQALGEAPELIPIVCHQGGEHVLWRNATYTAAGCPATRLAAAPAAATRHQRTQEGFDHIHRQLPKGSSIALAVQRLAAVSDEAVEVSGCMRPSRHCARCWRTGRGPRTSGSWCGIRPAGCTESGPHVHHRYLTAPPEAFVPEHFFGMLPGLYIPSGCGKTRPTTSVTSSGRIACVATLTPVPAVTSTSLHRRRGKERIIADFGQV